uniref:Membrane protein TerC, possibly involved in tellurium resistance n=1 Tax=uncultured gamma proteobacterium HF0200_24F15 TaxID=723570 RepID=E7C3Z2_9GAMM|nr:membrane protein TerC, possibly involved in tellurium resistance [uncultured gamma proteobacterium HF0200_24F15]
MLLDQISSLVQVILVDLILAGDNAIVIGMVAATVAKNKRRQVIFIGIAMAALMRVGFALITVQLLEVIGLLLIGGLLLLWISYKLWLEIRLHTEQGKNRSRQTSNSVGRAIFQIALADVSMSLDNVLAVAGIARHQPMILVFGLTLSIILMAAGATIVVRALERYRWISYAGLAVILYVAFSMIWIGIIDIKQYLSPL